MSDVVVGERGLRITGAHRAPVQAVAGVHGRELIVTAGGDGMIRSWDAGSGAAGAFVASGGDARISFLGVATVAGGGLVVSADNTRVRRFDLASGQEIGEPLRAPGTEWLPSGGLGPVAIHADGDDALVVAGGPMGVHRWNAVTGELIGEGLVGHAGKLLAVAALRLRGGRLMIVSSGADGLVRRWDAVSGEPVGAPLPGNRGPVTALACVSGAEGRDVVIAQEYRGPIRRWDAVTGEPLGQPMPQGADGVSGGGLAVSPDGRVLLSLDAGGGPSRWDLTLPEPVAEALSAPVSLVNAVAVASVGQGYLFVTGGEKGQLRRWDPAGRALGEELPGHPATVRELLVVPASPHSGGRVVLVSSGRDGARCWDAVTGLPVGAAPFDPLPVGDGLAAVWLPDGRLMLGSGDSEGFLRCDVFAGAIEHETQGLPDDEDDRTVWDVATGLLPDGRPFFAGAGVDGSVYLVDAATGEAVRGPLRGLKSQALAVAVATAADGTVMVAGGGEDRRILRWDAVTGDPIGVPLAVAEHWVMRLAFRALPDGRLLLLSVDGAGQVRRWDAGTGESIGDPLQAPGEPGAAPRLSAAAPGETIAVGCTEIVRSWNARTGQHLGDTADAGCATKVSLPDGRVVFAIGHVDGSITIGD